MLYSQGVPLEDARHPDASTAAPIESDPRAIWRLFAGALSPVPRHALAAVARLGVRRGVRARRRGSSRRPPTIYYDTIDAALKTDALPPARPVRAVQHRGDRHHRKPARPARPSPRDPRERLEGPGRHRLPPRSGDRSRDPKASPTIVAPLRRDRRARMSASFAGYLRAHENRRAFFREVGRDLDRSRPSDRVHRRPARAAEAEALYAKVARRRCHPGRGRAVPRPDADRDGADEPRRRHGDADPSRRASATTMPRCSRASAATRAPTSRSRPNMSARSSRCSTASATTRA